MKAEYDFTDAKSNPYIEKLLHPNLDTCASDYFKRKPDRTKDDNPPDNSSSQLKEPFIHPGEFLREDYMPELDLSVAKLAEKLGVTRQTVNDIVRERRNLSPEMCLKLGRLFGTTPQFWMNMQAKVDIWNSLELHRAEIEAVQPLEALTTL